MNPYSDPTRPTVTLCRGCCCGTHRKHPAVDHTGQLALLRERLRGRARLRATTCLGPCQRSNVAVVTPSRNGRRHGAHPVWLGWLLDDTAIHALADWAHAGGPGIQPLPDTLSLHQFHAPGPNRTQPSPVTRPAPTRPSTVPRDSGAHLPSPDTQHSAIDRQQIDEAIMHLPDPQTLHECVSRFALLADPTRLTLLLCIHHTGEIRVSDLATATGVNDSTASRALRLLRAHGAVATRRDGRAIHYHLTDNEQLRTLLDHLASPPKTQEIIDLPQYMEQQRRPD
jgi:DNA-binding transcriptional ArsR family regulator